MTTLVTSVGLILIVFCAPSRNRLSHGPCAFGVAQLALPVFVMKYLMFSCEQFDYILNLEYSFEYNLKIYYRTKFPKFLTPFFFFLKTL